jgi:predicted chitinase
MNITEDQLAAMLPTNREISEWCKVLNSALPKYEINNARRIAAFISQCAHESRDFTAMEENLNYSEKALNSCLVATLAPASATLPSMRAIRKRSPTTSIWTSFAARPVLSATCNREMAGASAVAASNS